MARYRKIDLRISSDREIRRLSRPQPNGQSLWIHLLTGRETGIIPGAFAARESGMAEELGWSLEGFREAFAEVSGEAFKQGRDHGAQKPLAIADWSAGFIWIPKAIKHNSPQSPNVVRSWADAWDELPECDLKAEAYSGLRAFMKGMGEAFLKAFDEVIPKPSWMPSPKTMANQEQEQEQEEDSDRDKSLSAPPGEKSEPPPPPTDPRKELFDLGIRLLGGSEKSSRGLIGKAVSNVGEKRVAEVLASMALKPPVEPRAYFAAAIQPKPADPNHGHVYA